MVLINKNEKKFIKILFFKQQKTIIQQKKYYIKEIYYKLYKLFVILLKWNKLLGNIIFQKKKAIYYKNLCIVSQRSKSIQRKLKVSRIIIRENSNKGLFFGLHKVSW